MRNILILEILQRVVIPCQIPSAQFRRTVQNQPGQNIPRLMRLEQSAFLVEGLEELDVLGVLRAGMRDPHLFLHLRVDDAGLDGHGGDLGLFDGEFRGQVLDGGFGAPVGAPSGEMFRGGTGRGEDDFASRGPE